MLKYDNTVSSTIDGKPIYGAQVSVFTAEDPNNPTLASLFADEAGTVALSQPILTDQLGYFAFYIPDGKYDIRVMTGVVEISRTNITMVDTLSLKNRALVVPQNEDSGTLPPAGERAGKLLAFDNDGLPQMAVPNSFEGPTGPANSTYTTLASLKAAAVTNASYIFAPPSGSDGGAAAGTFLYQTAGAPYTADGVNVVKLDDVPLSTGALVRQGADSIVAKIPASAAILRPVGEKLAETVSLLDFVPRSLHGDIVADLTPYITQAIAYVKALPNGGTITVPPGIFTGDWDCSNSDPSVFDKALRVVGAGRHSTEVRPAGTDSVIFNAIGRNHFELAGMSIKAGDVYSAQCGIFLSRSSASTNCNNNKFRDLDINGNFNRASVVSVGAESSLWENCIFRNTNPSALHRTFWTGVNPAKFPITQTAGTPVIGPNTDNRQVSCEHYVPYNGARPLTFSGQGGWSMIGCTIICGSQDDCHLVTYRDPDGSLFNGTIAWVSPHFEVFGNRNVIHFLEPEGLAIFNGISHYGGNTVVSTGTKLFDYDPTNVANRPILRATTITTSYCPEGVTGVDIRVYAVISSHIHWRPQPDAGVLIAIGFIDRSSVDTAEIRTTNLAGSTDLTLPVTVAPTSGTFGKGTLFRNVSGTIGAPTGWVQTTAGTFGTLSGITATTIAGSNRITVSSTSGLYDGAQITIATATGGPWVVQRIGDPTLGALTVYLDSVVSNAVSGQAVAFVAAAVTPLANL